MYVYVSTCIREYYTAQLTNTIKNNHMLDSFVPQNEFCPSHMVEIFLTLKT